ncbi:MAG: anhydro-N-acetylmuramic acid kinase [Bacillota bacterium]
MTTILEQLRQKPTKLVIGLNSGTSYDGIDAALVEITGSGTETRVKTIAFKDFPFSSGDRQKIGELFDPVTGTVDRICFMNYYLGELFAEAALQLIAQAGLKAAEIDLVGSHGQTVYHLPQPVMEAGRTIRATLQIGEAAVIAERTGILTVADFRAGDVAAGGQGAPLTAYADYLLFGQDRKTRLIQNIGGIGNVTLVGGAVPFSQIMAFDTGPGNMLIDAMVRMSTDGQLTYDRDGMLAARGMVCPDLLAELLIHPYLSQGPPKTTGREAFGSEYATDIFAAGQRHGLTKEDLAATVTAFTVETITGSYERFIYPRYRPDEVIVGGGGAYNPILLKWLQKRLAPITVRRHEDFGISSDAKEAILFAILANEAIHGVPANVPTATGARHPAVLGKIVTS